MTTRYNAVHALDTRNGPGDARPTAQQIIDDNELAGKWSDKIILVTGTSSGIGIDTVAALASTGAKVYAAARNLDKARAALASTPGNISYLELDTSSPASVRACAAAFLDAESKLHILINNAGIMAVPTRELTPEGHELQFATNHLGHFLLFQLLKPALLAATSPAFASRVVNVSSSAHRNSPPLLDDLTLTETYDPWISYGQSKTANIWMANEIERRYGAQGVHAWSLHPGGIMTGLGVHVDTTVWETDPVIRRVLKSPAQGAATTVLAAVDKELEGKGGKFLEDCGVPEPIEAEAFKKGDVLAPGYAPWVYDEDRARKLWELSCEIVGVKND